MAGVTIISANNYCYAGQAFYSLKKTNGVTTTSTQPTNTLGVSPVSVTQLNDYTFYTSNLNWSMNVWDFDDLNFASGKYPVLIR